MWHLCMGFEHKGFGNGNVKSKGKQRPSKRWKGALVPKGIGEGKGVGKGKSYLAWARARQRKQQYDNSSTKDNNNTISNNNDNNIRVVFCIHKLAS